MSGDSVARGRALRFALALSLSLSLSSAACTFWGNGTDNASDAGEDAAGSAGPEELAIATYNLRLFFDTICDSGACGGSNFEQVLSPAAFEARADAIAAAIDTLEVEILCLQELETQANLDALQERLPRFVSAHLAEQGYPGSLDTAVLATLPILEVISHLDEELPRPSGGTTTFSRDLIEIHFDHGGERVIFFCAHFRSKVSDDPERRLAEAQRTGEWLALRSIDYPEALIVLGGDLNDTPGSPPLVALETAAQVRRVAAELDDDTTHIFDGRAEAIDHLYLSEAAGGRHIAGSTTIYRTNTAMAWTGWGGSDHAALRAEFATTP